MDNLEKFPGEKVDNTKPQVDRYVFPDGHGIIVPAAGHLLNLCGATGYPSFVMSCSFANQVLAQIDLLTAKGYKNEACLLPKELDEKAFEGMGLVDDQYSNPDDQYCIPDDQYSDPDHQDGNPDD